MIKNSLKKYFIIEGEKFLKCTSKENFCLATTENKSKYLY